MLDQGSYWSARRSTHCPWRIRSRRTARLCSRSWRGRRRSWRMRRHPGRMRRTLRFGGIHTLGSIRGVLLGGMMPVRLGPLIIRRRPLGSAGRSQLFDQLAHRGQPAGGHRHKVCGGEALAPTGAKLALGKIHQQLCDPCGLWRLAPAPRLARASHASENGLRV